jgi:hypothetical protein
MYLFIFILSVSIWKRIIIIPFTILTSLLPLMDYTVQIDYKFVYWIKIEKDAKKNNRKKDIDNIHQHKRYGSNSQDSSNDTKS